MIAWFVFYIVIFVADMVITNINAASENYVSENPHFCKSALSQFTAQDFIALVEKHRISYHEKKLGQLFCDISAKQIVSMLVNECCEAGVTFQLGTFVKSLKKDHAGFVMETSQGIYAVASVVIATGGLSIPKIGATDFGYRMAKQFGLRVTSLSPALDGFRVTSEAWKPFSALAGISLDVSLSCDHASFRENILFTHVGLSGPAALQGSLYWNSGDAVTMDLLPEIDAKKWLYEKREARPNAEIKSLLREFFPQHFCEIFCEQYFPKMTILASASNRALDDCAQQLKAWKIFPTSTVGYSKAEVTRGGVDTNELSSKTMESKKVPGLSFIGEVVDVTGWLGGYNFQWAWSSGFAAGQNV